MSGSIRLGLLGLCLTALGATAANADPWYDVVFPEKSHDFGTVARGSKVRHTFRIVNTTSYDLHIADWRTKCGCTEVKVGARSIPPGTQTNVDVVLDTTQFQGYKASGLSLIFDQPQYVQVDLNLTSFIRTDVMLNPGVVDYQTIPRGKAASRTVTLNYFGAKPDWAITRLTTVSDHVAAELREQSRSSGTVSYQLTATLQDTAPPGNFRDEITLHTNDSESPTIPISVIGQVQAAITVAPAILNLGRMRPGQEVQKTVLVRSGQPFQVTGTTCSQPEVTAALANGEGQSRPFHTVTVTLKAPAKEGPFHAVLEIATDVAGEPPARLTAFATIVP